MPCLSSLKKIYIYHAAHFPIYLFSFFIFYFTLNVIIFTEAQTFDGEKAKSENQRFIGTTQETRFGRDQTRCEYLAITKKKKKKKKTFSGTGVEPQNKRKVNKSLYF